MNGANAPLRVILLTHGGAEKVLQRLIALEGVRVTGVFVETDVVRRYPLGEKLRRSVRYDGYVATALKLMHKLFRTGGNGAESGVALESSRDRLSAFAQSRGIPFHLVADYHAAESIALMCEAAPDLGVVYGTNIIKESVFGLPRLGSINLHQGLAPFYRGGPPVFWELFNGEKELGLTVHYVAAKVDAGEIILQERVPLEYDYATYGTRFESFVADYAERLKDPCARLVADAVRMIADGTARTQPQDISLGKRYRLPVKREKDELRRRLRARHGRQRQEATSKRLTARKAGAEE